MKKTVKYVISALILLLVFGKNTYATTGTAGLTINASKAEVKVGETVTFNVSANCETVIEGIDATLEYDNSKLELQNINVNAKFSNMSGKDEATGKYIFTVLLNTEEEVKQAQVATINFKVLDTAKVGDKITVKLSGIEVIDSDVNSIQVEDKNATIEVVESDDDDKKPGVEDEEPSGDDKKPGVEDEEPNDDDKKPSVEDEKTNDDDKKPSTEDKKPTNDNNKQEDKTQADKVIDKAGVEHYIFIISIISIITYISYKKYKEYKNI